MRLNVTVSALTALALGFTQTQPAAACGGLFCSASSPVNQAAERIIFAQGDGFVDAIIEIQYQGPSENFAWVLPVPAGQVDVGVSSKQVLDALQQQSNPQYTLNTTFENCGNDENQAFASATGSPRGDSAQGADDESAVTVTASGTVGPFDYVQLAVDEALPNAVDVALNWLADNSYDVSNLGGEVLAIYLDQGMDLIAFRLTKGNDAGSIRPVSLRYAGDNPIIPIRPTAVAANDDMGVMVWVLGNARAIPENYLHLELNEAKINWYSPGSTYNAVVIAAADEAGGKGFVTEQSGPSSAFRDALLPTFVADGLETLRNAQFSSLQQFFYNVISTLQTFDPITFNNVYYDGFLEVMNDAELLPLREGATAEQFVACIDCYFTSDVAVRNDAYPSTPYEGLTDPIHGMNVVAFLDALEAAVVQPLRDAQALFDAHSTVTRFYTALSADEMDTDPIFAFNEDLPAYSNVHTAEQLIKCNGAQQITLPQGIVLNTTNSTWPVSIDDSLPLNLRLLQLSTSGKGDVAQDNRETVSEELEDLGVGYVVAVEGGSFPDAPARGVSEDGGGCSLTKTSASTGSTLAGLGWLALCALLRVRRPSATAA
jgi:hypothetical protein